MVYGCVAEISSSPCLRNPGDGIPRRKTQKISVEDDLSAKYAMFRTSEKQSLILLTLFQCEIVLFLFSSLWWGYGVNYKESQSSAMPLGADISESPCCLLLRFTTFKRKLVRLNAGNILLSGILR